MGVESESSLKALAVKLTQWFNIPWVIPVLLFFMASVLMLLVGGPMVRGLKNLRGMKWSPREDTPESHLSKAGTPSMGGLGIIGVAIAAWFSLLCLGFTLQAASGKNSGAPPWTLLVGIFAFMPVVLALHGALGFADDWSKARGRGGLRARTKLAGQIVLALAFLIGFVSLLTVLWTPSTTGLRPLMPMPSSWQQLSNASPVVLLYIAAFAVFILLAAGNALNLTDGIDGLAAGLSVQCGLALCLVGWSLRGEDALAGLTGFFFITVAGACLGFLRFNKYRAQVFMGDTGSLALGATLGAGAILCHAVWLLPFMGFIFALEATSVTLQVLYFKWTKRQTGQGKRLFKRAPLHHHFELAGWTEWRVVLTFWIINLVTTCLGLLLWKTEVLPRWP